MSNGMTCPGASDAVSGRKTLRHKKKEAHGSFEILVGMQGPEC